MVLDTHSRGEAAARQTEGHKKGQNSVTFNMPIGRYDGEFRDLAKIIRGEKKLAWDAVHDITVHETVMLASK